MRLLFLEEHPRFIGGSERMSLALCRHAVRRGHAAWLAHAEAGDMAPAYAAAGGDCRQVPVRPIAVREPATAWRSCGSLRTLVRSERIDVIFTSQVNFASLLAVVGMVTGALTAMHLGLVYDYPSPVFRFGMRRIALAVAPSTHTAEGWRARGWPTRSLRVIPNGVDTETFSAGDGRRAARARLGLGDRHEPLVAYVGRLVPEKGIFTLVRAFAGYRRSGGAGHLLFVGQGAASASAALRAVASDARLSDDEWEIRPAMAAPEDVYRAADLVVVPSECDEAYGLVPLEAMACGTVAIVSDRSLLPSFVSAGGDEAIFPAGDAASLQARLAWWLSDRERRELAAARLASATRSTHSFDACGDAYLAAFQSRLR